MQIILREDISNLGKSGELVSVKPGYGRNYLIPQGLAVLATERNVKLLEHHKRTIAQRNAKLMKDGSPEIINLAFVFDGIVAQFVGRAIDRPAADTTTS